MFGSACDGQIRAYAQVGRLTAVELDHRPLALPAPELAGHIVSAINSALVNGPAPPEPDLAALATLLGHAQDEGLRTMERISSSIQDAIARIGQRTGMHGDTGRHGLDDLLTRTMHELRATRAALTGGPLYPAMDPDELVRVEVDRLCRIRSLELSPPALRQRAGDLAENIVTATNTALAAVPANQAAAGTRGPTTIDRVRHLQERSLAQLHSYTRSLRAIMGTIGDP